MSSACTGTYCSAVSRVPVLISRSDVIIQYRKTLSYSTTAHKGYRQKDRQIGLLEQYRALRLKCIVR